MTALVPERRLVANSTYAVPELLAASVRLANTAVTPTPAAHRRRDHAVCGWIPPRQGRTDQRDDDQLSPGLPAVLNRLTEMHAFAVCSFPDWTKSNLYTLVL